MLNPYMHLTHNTNCCCRVSVFVIAILCERYICSEVQCVVFYRNN